MILTDVENLRAINAELLAACEAVVAKLEFHSSGYAWGAVEILTAAIKKAKGEQPKG